jgi:tetratricopeptide (TPR) repeat protein
LKAADTIDSSVFVFEGRFEIPLAAALAHAQKAGVFLAGKRLPEALQEAQQAMALAPNSAEVNAQMGNVLDALGRREEARAYYTTALQLAITKQPEFQHSLVAPLKRRLATEDDSAP